MNKLDENKSSPWFFPMNARMYFNLVYAYELTQHETSNLIAKLHYQELWIWRIEEEKNWRKPDTSFHTLKTSVSFNWWLLSPYTRMLLPMLCNGALNARTHVVFQTAEFALGPTLWISQYTPLLCIVMEDGENSKYFVIFATYSFLLISISHQFSKN